MVAAKLTQHTAVLPLLSLLALCQRSDLMTTVSTALILPIFYALRLESSGLQQSHMRPLYLLCHSCSVKILRPLTVHLALVVVRLSTLSMPSVTEFRTT